MRSHRGGSLSATTQVKVLSSEITRNATGQGLHFPETKIRSIEKGENESGVPESKSVAGKQNVFNGTWENQIVPKRSYRGVEETTREYGGLEVGLTHIRGVSRVMPVESKKQKTLEGVSSKTQREEFRHAIH